MLLNNDPSLFKFRTIETCSVISGDVTAALFEATFGILYPNKLHSKLIAHKAEFFPE